MTISIQVLNDKISDGYRQRVRRQVQKLSTVNSRIIAANILLRKENGSSGKNSLCEIRLVIKGNDLFGKSASANYDEALSAVIESLRKKLTKKKTEILQKRRTASRDEFSWQYDA